jgi:dipeptidyl aminopeptidase/acylaminoacyl peptidase
MGYFMRTDPLVVARRVKQPVLILQGDTDQQVTPEQADTLAAAMRAAGNRAVTLQRFPATNHLLLADPVGAPAGYAALPDTKVRRELLGTLADWLTRTLR